MGDAQFRQLPAGGGRSGGGRGGVVSGLYQLVDHRCLEHCRLARGDIGSARIGIGARERGYRRGARARGVGARAIVIVSAIMSAILGVGVWRGDGDAAVAELGRGVGGGEAVGGYPSLAGVVAGEGRGLAVPMVTPVAVPAAVMPPAIMPVKARLVAAAIAALRQRRAGGEGEGEGGGESHSFR